MPTLESKGKIVDISELSLALPPKEVTKRWQHLFKSIPKGKAFVTTEKALGVSRHTARSILTEYKKRGWAPKELRTSYRKRKDGDYDIYFIHGAEPTTKEKEAE